MASYDVLRQRGDTDNELYVILYSEGMWPIWLDNSDNSTAIKAAINSTQG